MQQTKTLIVGQLVAAHRRGTPLVLLFDYDGTLTPIVDRPELAVLSPRAKRLLGWLSRLPSVHVGVVSARRLDELKAIFDMPSLYLSGVSGSEVELRGKRREAPGAAAAAALMDEVATAFHAELAGFSGAWIEHKRLALTIHYRHLAEHLSGDLQATVARTIRRFANDLQMVQGPKAWEIVARGGRTKADAVRLIMADVGTPNPLPLYAGDGPNDAEAMEAVIAMGGVAFSVGPYQSTAAACRLPNPDALLAFLDDLVEALAERKLSPV